jgi:hypothetical protein
MGSGIRIATSDIVVKTSNIVIKLMTIITYKYFASIASAI